MNQAANRPLPQLDRATLGRACLRHLEEEATFLERVREALRELREPCCAATSKPCGQRSIVKHC